MPTGEAGAAGERGEAGRTGRAGEAAATGRRLAVVGGGWAGLAAAVEAVRRGDRVTLFEMAPQLGGRARSFIAGGKAGGRGGDGGVLDNGQHILIGAYVETLALMRTVGVDPDTALLRMPLKLLDPQGRGLQLGGGPPTLAFAKAVATAGGWSWRDRFALLAAAGRWRLAGFRCPPTTTVAELTAALPARVRRELIEPLCVAALNTPADAAAASTFLRVLKDALLGGRGSADLLLPRLGLSDLLPDAAQAWLAARGTDIRTGWRVERIGPHDAGWQVDGETFDAVVLASSPVEAARLARTVSPAWADTAEALRHEPIVTVYLQAAEARLPLPMLALHADAVAAPAQFVFDRGQLGGPAGWLAFVVSGARGWVERGVPAIEAATIAQATDALRACASGPFRVVRTVTEKRATFRCTPALSRPPARIAAGLHAAGDHVEGPYPATLEGAVRSGLQAARSID